MITPIDYPTISSWWTAHNWPVLPQEMLPKRGYTAFVGEKPVIAGFLYKDETATFGMVEWIVSNPDSTKEERAGAFEELIGHIEGIAKEIGVSLIFVTAKNPSLIEKLKKSGFLISDSSVTHLTKGV